MKSEMSTQDIVFCVVNVVIFTLLIILALSAIIRLASAAFSSKVRLSIRQRPAAHRAWFISGLLSAFLLIYCYAEGRSEKRARFINFINDLKLADHDLRHYGSYTNQSKYSKIYACTNFYTVGGTNYQCEFCGEMEEFSNQGTLAISTNQIFIWIDKKRGVVPLLRQDSRSTFPPGI
jgi:hypothetical protein